MSRIALLTLTTAYLLASVAGSHAQILTVPAGLAPGTQYRLIFVTNDYTTASSTDIATYNAFVTVEANSVPALAALNTTWTDLGETATSNAWDNTGTNPSISTGVAFYNLGGYEVAANNPGFWSGSLMNSIYFTQTGDATSSDLVWTGFSANGGTDYPETLGGTGNVQDTVVAGSPFSAGVYWADAFSDQNTRGLPLYAVSGILTVVPEASSAAYLLLGFAALTFWWLMVARKGRVRA